MKSRLGNVVDFSDERRKEIFDMYHELEGKESYTEIAHRCGISYTSLRIMKTKRAWWKDLEAERNA